MNLNKTFVPWVWHETAYVSDGALESATPLLQ